MKYIQSFNEKFGIKFELEKQAKVFFNEILTNINKNEFIFTYVNEKGSFPFLLKIGKIKEDGIFQKDISTNKLIIFLSDRKDYSTFLHELKHLDYSIVKKYYYKDILKVASDKLKILKEKDHLDYAKEMFYLLDTNEFESRYHGYYVDFDKFISENLNGKPTPSDIYDLFKKFLLQLNDVSWTWYIYDHKFKFEDHFTENQINRLFHQFISTKDFYKDEYNNIFNYITSYLKKTFKSTFNKYTSEELVDIRKSKKIIEKKINQKLPKYKRKFLKLVTLMIDKWCE